MTNSELTRIDNIKRSLKALLLGAGEARIEQGFLIEYDEYFSAWWLYIENPQTSKSFWSLDALENYVLCKIHALSLLQVSIPTPEQRRQKIALKRMYGNFEDSERN